MNGLKMVWQRLTTSKVAWLGLAAGVASILKALFDLDLGEQLEIGAAGLFAIISIFVAANNPTDKNNF